MTDLDLFGQVVHEPVISDRTGVKKKRNETARGYAARPGSGPEGETCGTCEHTCHVAGGGSKFYKCAIIKHRWTGGPGTDIRLKSPACSHWMKFVPPIPPDGYRWLKFGEIYGVGDWWVKDGQLEHEIHPGGLVGRKLPKDCVYLIARKLP